MVTGMTNIQAGVQSRRWGSRTWWLPLAVGILCVVLGIYALLAPGAGAVMVMRLVGVMMLCSALVNLISVLTWRDLSF